MTAATMLMMTTAAKRWKNDDAMAMGQAALQWQCLIPEAGGVIMVGTAAVGHNRLIAVWLWHGKLLVVR